MGEEHKSWWQTAAGLMTGIAALMTAFTGLFVALHQIRKDSEDGKRSATGQTQPLTDGRSSKEEPKTPLRDKQPGIARPPVIDRPAYSVALPAKHEFVLGSGPQSGRFILTSARMEPHTAESDILKVGVQVLADGQMQFEFYSMQFELRVDETSYRSTTNFDEFIPVGQSRDHDLHFTIPHGSTRAVLWIRDWLSGAEIPFDLTAPK